MPGPDRTPVDVITEDIALDSQLLFDDLLNLTNRVVFVHIYGHSYVFVQVTILVEYLSRLIKEFHLHTFGDREGEGHERIEIVAHFLTGLANDG
jgi:hypothetical protein